MLLFVGASIPGAADDSALRLHTSITVPALVLLWARVAWRLVVGHPAPLPTHKRRWSRLGHLVHLGMIAAVAVMLVSGPLMAWSGGIAVHVFDWFVLASPFGRNETLFALFHGLHARAATVLVVLICIHVAGVLKHVMFDRDKTLDRIMVAAKAPD